MRTTILILTGIALLLPALPLLAAGSGGGSPTMNAILALWPYITILVLLLVAFMWYQQFRLWQRRRKDGNRRATTRGNQSTTLVLLTVFAVLLLVAPPFFKQRYEKLFTRDTERTMDPENRTELTLRVSGMTCTGCEGLIMNRVGELPGVESVTADHMAGEATVVFDKSSTDRETIARTIADAGYKVEE